MIVMTVFVVCSISEGVSVLTIYEHRFEFVKLRMSAYRDHDPKWSSLFFSSSYGTHPISYLLPKQHHAYSSNMVFRTLLFISLRFLCYENTVQGVSIKCTLFQCIV